MIRPTVINQGMTVIENNDGEYMIMHPDGSVRVAMNKADAERIAKDWYRNALGRGSKIGLGDIEWRL